MARKNEKSTDSSYSVRANLAFPLANTDVFRLCVHQSCSSKECLSCLLLVVLFLKLLHFSKMMGVTWRNNKDYIIYYFRYKSFPALDKYHENLKFCLMWNFIHSQKNLFFFTCCARALRKKKDLIFGLSPVANCTLKLHINAKNYHFFKWWNALCCVLFYSWSSVTRKVPLWNAGRQSICSCIIYIKKFLYAVSNYLF